jgi:hypothetical protein
LSRHRLRAGHRRIKHRHQRVAGGGLRCGVYLTCADLLCAFGTALKCPG